MSAELEQKIKDLKASNEYLQGRLNYYEQDGIGKLYHALNRKANEMADLLNNNTLTAVPIEDPKDKTFDRLQKIWTDAESISNAIKALGTLSGVQNEESKESAKKEIVINKPYSPETVADEVGELAGKRN